MQALGPVYNKILEYVDWPDRMKSYENNEDMPAFWGKSWTEFRRVPGLKFSATRENETVLLWDSPWVQDGFVSVRNVQEEWLRDRFRLFFEDEARTFVGLSYRLGKKSPLPYLYRRAWNEGLAYSVRVIDAAHPNVSYDSIVPHYQTVCYEAEREDAEYVDCATLSEAFMTLKGMVRDDAGFIDAWEASCENKESIYACVMKN